MAVNYPRSFFSEKSTSVAATSVEPCEDLAQLRAGEAADVTVVCVEDTYHLHADLLAAKSRFFATALDIAMVEKREGKVVVKEVKPETFKKVVRYNYENKLVDEKEGEGMDLGGDAGGGRPTLIWKK